MRSLVALCVTTLSLLGCGGNEPPRAPAPTPPPAAKKAPAKPKMSVASELGEIDAQAVEATFARAQPTLLACLEQRTSSFDGVAGAFSVFLRISDEGRMRWGHLESSSLGDRRVEKCILGAFRNTQWPRPDHGDAEVRTKLEFDLPEDVRPPTVVPASRVQGALASAMPRLSACRGAEKGTVDVTAYVATNGSVLSAGAASKNGKLAGELDCIADAVRTLSLPSPGSYPGKLTFPID